MASASSAALGRNAIAALLGDQEAAGKKFLTVSTAAE